MIPEPDDMRDEVRSEPELDEIVPEAILADEDRLLLVLAYLGPLCLVPLLTRRDPFVRWHARQGLALAVAAAAAIVLLTPLDWVFGLVPVFDRLFVAFEMLAALGYLVVVALSVERALSGRKFRVPWLADLADED